MTTKVRLIFRCALCHEELAPMIAPPVELEEIRSHMHDWKEHMCEPLRPTAPRGFAPVVGWRLDA